MLRENRLSKRGGGKGILSFDFDGTLHSSIDTCRVHRRTRQRLLELSDAGFLWGVNTGRSMEHTMEGVQEAEFFSMPDFIVAREREVYFLNASTGEYEVDRDWLALRDISHARMFERYHESLKEIRGYIEQQTKAKWVSEPREEAAVVATSIAEMDQILEFVDPYVKRLDQLDYLRSTIYLRFTHKNFHKGSSLSYIAEKWQIQLERVFAVGDGENDLGMLHPDFAGMHACPANAVAAVRERVSELGGFVAEAEVSLGVLQALDFYFGKRVS